MPEADPTLDTSSAASADESMEVIASAIETGMAVVGGLLGNACANRTDLFNRWQFAQRLNSALITGATWWADVNQLAVRNGISNWGRGARGAAGGKPFGTYLQNQYYIWNPARIRPNLKNGRGLTRPPSQNSGDKIGPGVYVNTADQSLQGSRVVQAYDTWVRWMADHVYAPATGRVNWQSRLRSWVGQSRDDWRVWVPGDAIAANSRIGRNLVMIENLGEQLRVVSEDCVRGLNIAEQLAVAQSETEQGIIAADLERGLAEEATERTQAITFGLVAFGVTWLLARGRK